MSSRPQVLRIGLQSAFDTIRTYPASAVLLGAALLAALGAVLPLASLFGRPGDPWGFTPAVHPIPGGDLGLFWTMGVSPPAVAQQEAVSRLGALLLAAVCGTLLVAIVTIISLGIARSGETRVERLVCRAVGASRRMSVAAALIEAGLIGAVSAPIGLLIGLSWARAASAGWPGMVPERSEAGLVAGAALLVTVFVAALVYPAAAIRRRTGEESPGLALPTIPVVFQIAVSLIVLFAGALIANRSSGLLTSAPVGSGAGTLLSLSLETRTPADRSAQLSRLLDGLEAKGLHSLSLTSPGTLTGLGHAGTVITDCGNCREGGLALPFRIKPATHRIVSADTFRLMGLSVLAGRGITEADDWDAPRVAVVSRSLATREFQNGEPIGRRIHTGHDDAEGSTVVGIVEDRLATGLGGSLQPRYGVYVSVLQHPPRQADLLLRAEVSPDAVANAVQAAFPPGTARYQVQPEAAAYTRAAAPVSWFGWWFRFQGWMTAGLALIGIGVFVQLWVRSLQGEIGVRRSVGARRRQIMAWVLGRAAGVALKGVALGLWAGVAVWGTLPALVTGTDPWDFSAMAPFMVLLAAVILGSALPPAWRASRARR